MAKANQNIDQDMARLHEIVTPLATLLKQLGADSITTEETLSAKLREVLKRGQEGHMLGDEYQVIQARTQWVELSISREKSTSRRNYYTTLLKSLENASRAREMNIVKAAVVPVIAELAGADGDFIDVQAGIAINEQDLQEESNKLLRLTQMTPMDDGEIQSKAGEFEAAFDREIARTSSAISEI